MKWYFRFWIFLLLNFVALAIGGIFTAKGVPSGWYQSLEKAPWSPENWVFGAVWTFIMVCFALYMALAWRFTANHRSLLVLFVAQWMLNVLWNPVFFQFHHVFLGLMIITGLTFLMGYFLLEYFPQLKAKSLLVLPYFIWLVIATSLNGYIYFNNH